MFVCFAYYFKALLAAGNGHCSEAAPTLVSAVVLHVCHQADCPAENVTASEMPGIIPLS